jgi:hypothetical protein
MATAHQSLDEMKAAGHKLREAIPGSLLRVCQDVGGRVGRWRAAGQGQGADRPGHRRDQGMRRLRPRPRPRRRAPGRHRPGGRRGARRGAPDERRPGHGLGPPVLPGSRGRSSHLWSMWVVATTHIDHKPERCPRRKKKRAAETGTDGLITGGAVCGTPANSGCSRRLPAGQAEERTADGELAYSAWYRRSVA